RRRPCHPHGRPGTAPVDRRGHRRPPVEHHRLAAAVVHHVPAPDVPALPPAGQVEPAEEQRRGRVVGEGGQPAGQGPAERLGGEGVAGDVPAGGEQGGGPVPHPPEGGPGRGEVELFGLYFVPPCPPGPRA